MDNLDFCHLHNHSFFSLLDGLPHPKDYVKYAKKLGFKHIGLTDHGSVSGLIKFQNSCLENDIHPVLGMEGYIVPNMTVREKGYGHINFFIKNAKGYKTLLNFMTVSNKVGFYYKPRMDFDLLLNSDLDGLIITTACAGSFLNLAGGEEFFNKLNDKIGDNLLIEIMPHRIEAQSKVHEKINRLLNSSIILEDRLISSNDCHYCKDGDEFAQDVLLAINRRAKWDDPKRFSFGFNGLYLRTTNEMINEFKKQGDFTDDIINKAMLNTVNIAERCNFTIPKKEISLPRIPMVVKDNLNEEDLVLDICEKGYKKLIGDYNKEYVDRLEFEFSIIKEKNFLRYFLLLWDIIEYCKENNIPYGPGRGSAAGSLMSYLMGITKVDPIKYGLFFERFLSIDRCLVGDTKIVTKNGLKEIRNINRGDTVINRNGDFDTVVKVGKRHVKEKLLKIYFNNSYVICTKDHKWIILDKNNKEVEKRAKDIDILKDKLIRFVGEINE